MPRSYAPTRHQTVMQLLALAIMRMHEVRKNDLCSHFSDDGVQNRLDFHGESSVHKEHVKSVK